MGSLALLATVTTRSSLDEGAALGVQVREPRRLNLVARQQDIVAQNAQLKDGLSSDTNTLTFDEATGGVFIRSRRGETVLRVGLNLVATPAVSPKTIDALDDRDVVHSGDGQFQFSGSSGGGQFTYVNRDGIAQRLGTMRFDSPEFVIDRCQGDRSGEGGQRHAVRLVAPEGFIVVHRHKMGDFEAPVISRIDEKGTEVWRYTDQQTQQGAAHAVTGRLIGEDLVVVLGEPGNFVVALNATSGALRWRYRHQAQP